MEKLPKFDEIGPWSEIKLEIISEYARAYAKILANQRFLKFAYIDAFSGAGMHKRKKTGDLVPGSPLRALAISPAFHRYVFIDLNGKKAAHLRRFTEGRADVQIHQGDCNPVLLDKVFPSLTFESYWRALCVLDPYALHLDWEVLAEAAQLGTVDIFLNFPIMDMNRNALWRDAVGVDPADLDRMDRFWGDRTWRDVAYHANPQLGLFGDDPGMQKQPNETIAEAFQERLTSVAGFNYVPKAIPMRNSSNAVLYYLMFASQNTTANKVANAIFRRHERPERNAWA